MKFHTSKCSHVVPDALSRRPYEITHTKADDALNQFPDLDSVKSHPTQKQQPKRVTFNDDTNIIHYPDLDKHDNRNEALNQPWLPTDYDV